MKHKVAVEIMGYVTSAFVQLEGLDIGLSYDGDKTWKATKELEIVGDLDLVFKVRGLNGTDWTISITLDDTAKPTFKESGTIQVKNYSLLKKSIPVN
jgi:hypothetical protein